MPERDPKAEAVVLARKAEDDAKAMRLLASDPEVSDEIVGFHAQQAVEKWLKAREVVALTEHAVPLRYDELLDIEPLNRQAVVGLVDEVGAWAGAQLR